MTTDEERTEKLTAAAKKKLHKYQAKKGNQSELEQENKLLVEKIIKAQETINELELKVEQTQEKNKQLTLAIRHQLGDQEPIIIDNEYVEAYESEERVIYMEMKLKLRNLREKYKHNPLDVCGSCMGDLVEI
ncbi:hypothetical protein K501DRAFT_330973 [Backusella circina FSU 941]|nr:hypothetical protein K501DRAFT_330973 [Backusella circina FSU 941]